MKATRKVISNITVCGAGILLLIALLFPYGFAITAAAQASGIDPWQALQEAIDQAEAGDVITLSEDVTAHDGDSPIILAAGKRITLDLNGHTLDRNLKINGNYNGCVIYIQEGAILTLRDSGEAAGIITGGYHDNGGGIQNHGTLIMEGGSVTGNTALHDGGGIANYGMMILTGGSVTGNTSLGRGGGIYNQAKAYLTIHGEPVSGNSAPGSPDIVNEGTLSYAGDHDDGAYREDMPALKRFMTQLSVLPAAVILLFLLPVVWLDNYLSRERKRFMIVIIVLVFGLMLQNYLEFRFALLKGSNALRLPLSVFGYAVRPAILALFLFIVKPGGKYRLAWVMVAVNAAVYMTAFFSDIAFRYTGDSLSGGHFKEGPLHQSCTVVSALLFAWLLILTLRQFHLRAKRESWIPILVTTLIAGAVFLDFTLVFNEQPVSFLTMAIAISCVFYYIWLHLQFVRRHEQELKAGQRIRIMMSQIQPHFLFNSLEVIRRLYRKEPEKADNALVEFERYLRGNMDSLEQEGLIPFQSELEHTKLYLHLEQLRFPDELRIVYDLRCTDFLIPPLTLQPLAENAVRHGVRGKKSGEGTVKIATEEYEDRFEITVTDDGNGFDPNAVPRDDHTHIGLNNVRERLHYAGAELRIRTGPEGGTEAVIAMPKTDQGGGTAQ